MKKLLLMIILTFVSTSAIARWDSVFETDDGVYFTHHTFKKKKSVIEVWLLYNLKKPQIISDKIMYSNKQLHEYDCDARKVRILAIASYNKKMGAGAVIEMSSEPSKWHHMVPDSTAENILNFQCQRKLPMREQPAQSNEKELPTVDFGLNDPLAD